MGGINTLFGLRDRLAAFLGFSHKGRRDLYEAFGYERIVLSEQLWAMYRRNDVANRIVTAFPRATWREMPTFCDEDGETPDDSEFVSAVQDFIEENCIQIALERCDRVANVGRFGILVMGFDDGENTAKPLEPGHHKLTYIQPYGDFNTTVSSWDMNPRSKRFGLPILYTVTVNQPAEERNAPARSLTVHYTRAIHLAEQLDEDEVFGLPRLLPVYNRLKDMEKVVGGSAETFWNTANRGVAFMADPDADLTDDEITNVKEQVKEFEHGMRRMLVGQGMTAQVLGSEVPDPKPNVETLLDLIAGTVGIPKRILIGSERGELSSAQDENNWATRIEERRNMWAAPKILRPFIEKMIETGNLPEPSGKWYAKWAQGQSLSPLQEAELNERRSNALKNYVTSPGSDIVVPIDEFRESFLGLEPLPADIDDVEDLFDEETYRLTDVPGPEGSDTVAPEEEEADEAEDDVPAEP